MTTIEFRLVGAGGEPVDLVRTLNSHGFVDLPPMRPSADYRSLEITLSTGRGRPRTVRIHAGRDGHGAMTVVGPAVSAATAERLATGVRHVLRLDADLSPFYAMAAEDPDLSWTVRGAGRMVQSPTVFEDVVKTVCTTNCAWSATRRMVDAIVEHLGEPAPGAPPEGPFGRAFPPPERMAEAGEGFYRDVARAGYRGPYLIALARMVAEGGLDLERFSRAGPEELPDDEMERQLLALPGVGPYAAAHIMMTVGRYHRLILDSWTRPTYAKKVGRKAVTDAAIERRFRRYGPYAGLAFWLFLTRDWVEENVLEPA
ncbi:MAG TPA: Fe-S cluster assembly protein HesB [Actinomycetota bacterium]|nr:Fe-S cluster assembly protein HesB [Actinomycetota bacterium]